MSERSILSRGGPVVARPTLLDRAIAWVNPALGLERLKARSMLALAGGYHGGKRDRKATKRWRPDGGSADADIIPDLPELRARSRDLIRNVPLAGGAISTQATNVVGHGLKLQAGCDRTALGLDDKAADDWNRQAQAEFALACRTADFARRVDFDEMQALVLRSMLESGDVLAIRRWRQDAGDTYGAKLQLIEADRLCNPLRGADTDTLVDGVEFNASGVPVGYNIASRHPGDYRRSAAITWRRVPARYNDGRPIVLHLMDVLRIGQSRGAPYLSPVIETLRMLGEYTDAEARGALVNALFTVFIKSPADEGSGPLPSAEGGDGDEIELGTGAVVGLNPGEDIEFANPNRPNAAFDGFIMALCRHIGVALELPYEVLIKHFTSSYSASRAALEMAWQTFRRRRAWLARRFCQPFYEWVIEEAIILGRIDAPGFFDDPALRMAWLKAEWIGPVRISLDPKKDSDADRQDVEMLFKTRAQVITERTGGDFESKLQQAKREKSEIDAAGLSAPLPAGSLPDPAQADPQQTKEDLADA